jgi:SOS-response transcriptional repressor LexA
MAELLRFDPRDVRPEIQALPAWMLDAGAAAPPDGFSGDNVSPARSVRRVPLVSWVAAGRWGDAEDPYLVGEGHAEVNVYDRVGPRAFALTVRGESMTAPSGLPSFPAGTTIIVDPDVEAQPGRFVVVRLEGDDEATFKRLSVDGGRTFLEPLNPRYPVIEVDRPMTIVGVVTHITQMAVV